MVNIDPLPPLIPKGVLAEVTASGPIDGTGANHSEGSYVRITLTRPHERYIAKISRGAAEVLVAELQGVLANGR